MRPSLMTEIEDIWKSQKISLELEVLGRVSWVTGITYFILPKITPKVSKQYLNERYVHYCPWSKTTITTKQLKYFDYKSLIHSFIGWRYKDTVKRT